MGIISKNVNVKFKQSSRHAFSFSFKPTQSRISSFTPTLQNNDFFLMKGTQTLVIEYAKCRLACHHLTEAEGRFKKFLGTADNTLGFLFTQQLFSMIICEVFFCKVTSFV